MRTTIALAVAIAGAVPALAAAQERPALEVGTAVGLTISRLNGASRTTVAFGIPGGATDVDPGFSTASLYLAIFPSDHFFVEPEFAVYILHNSSSTYDGLGLVGWLDYAPAGVTTGTPYLGVAPAFHRIGGDHGSSSQPGFAGRVGYRTIVRESLALRFEAGFQHWLENDDFLGHDVLTLRIGIGAILKAAT